MVCFRRPRKPNHLLIKRIAALETPLGRIDVPKNHIWVVSDGGNGYLDSSVFGVVNFNDVLGDAKFIVFPPHRIGKIQVNSFTLVRNRTGQLHLRRKIGIFLSLRLCSLLRKTQTVAASVNQP